MADLPDWPYWKVISITGQAGAGTDYQVELEIGDSAGGDFHLEGHCTNFPQDIRITDDDGTTLLDYWVEDLTADPIVVHIEVKDDLGSNQDIRVYYGKSGETTASDGNATFPFFDNFPGSSVDTGKWENDTGVTVSGGMATCAADSMNSIMDFSDPVIMESRRQFSGASSGNVVTLGFGALIGNSIWAYRASDNRLIKRSGGSAYDVNTNWVQDSYVVQKIIWDGATPNTEWYENDVAKTGSPSSTTAPTIDLPILVESANNGIVNIDWIFVRKYNDPEPAFSSAGAEQTPAVGAIMNQFQGANIGADLYNGVFA